MNCDNCPSNGGLKYVWGQKLTGFGGVLTQTQIDILDQKVREETQCQLVPRYSLDSTEVIVQGCRIAPIKNQDIKNLDLDGLEIWATAAEARAYITANILNWEVPEIIE